MQRGGFLSDSDRACLDRFPLDVNRDDLVRCFSLGGADLDLVWGRLSAGARLAGTTSTTTATTTTAATTTRPGQSGSNRGYNRHPPPLPSQRRSHRQPHQPQPPLPSQRRSHRQPHQPQPPLRQLQRRFRRIRVIQRTAQISLLTTRPRRGLTPTSRTTEMWLGLTATTTESLASRSPETLRLAYWFGWNAKPQRTA